LHNTTENIASAKAQAIKEGYNPKNRRGKRRVYQIMEEGRGDEMMSAAEQYGKRVTLNYEPEGFTRPIYKAALSLQRTMPITKMFIPFTRIVTNLTENALNYTPLAYIKSISGKTKSEGGVRVLTPDERADFAIKATIGLSAYILLSGLSGEDDDDLFVITANGTGNPTKNYELMQSGWRPFSIILKDGTTISYKDWPIASLLAAVGAQHDESKYGTGSEPSPAAVIAAAGFVSSLYNKSVLKGIQEFFGIITPSEDMGKATKWTDRLTSYAADQSKSILMSNFTQQAFKMYAETMNDPMKAASGAERIYRDVPFLNDHLNPIINSFGEPVKPSTTDRLTPVTKPSVDNLSKILSENGVFIGKPKTVDIFTDDDQTRPMTDKEYFNYAKRSGELTKQYMLEEYEDLKELLAIENVKERRKAIKDWVQAITSSARQEALGELFYD